MQQMAKIRIRFLYVLLTLFSVTGMSIGSVNAGHPSAKINSTDLVIGTGAEAIRHTQVSVLYTGWLMDGTKFDSSSDREKPFIFTLASGQVIQGWDMGVTGMKVGGKRELIIPPELAYGDKESGPIPAKSTLRFEVELVSVEPPKYTNINNETLKSLLAKGVKIVDLRRLDEWRSTGIVDGSKLLTAFDGSGQFVRDFLEKLQKFVKPNEEVILICRTGHRSSTIANMLSKQAGYTKIYNLKDGIANWMGGGNPVVKM